VDVDLLLTGVSSSTGRAHRPAPPTSPSADGRIVAVAPHLDLTATERLDISGLAISPGFIDAHTHDDFALLVHPDMAFKVLGGVTTCIVGNCGMGAAPFGPASTMAATFHPGAELQPWDGYAGYLDRLTERPASVNAAVLIGHGTVRADVMGNDPSPPDDRQLDRLRELVAEGMAAGCIGMSTGLVYEPGSHAGTDELVALAQVVGSVGGLYTSHIRNEGDRLLESIAEAIEVGRRAAVPVVISHLKAIGAGNWGRVVDALALIEAANAEGVQVAADQYPYTAGSTVLAALVTQGSFDSGEGGLGHTDPAMVVIASAPATPEREGLTIAHLAEHFGTGPGAAARRQLDDDPRTTVVLHTMSEDDVRTVLAHDGIMIGSDGLPTLEGTPHPRLYGTFARVLGRYARDEGVLSLEAAVHRMTGRTAEVFGLTDRGLVAPGRVADLTVFDPARILDLGTYEAPHAPPRGIAHVLVAGTPVVRNGAHTGARPGRVLHPPKSPRPSPSARA
jgi:N-acyl-D-amino-acid deacylase